MDEEMTGAFAEMVAGRAGENGGMDECENGSAASRGRGGRLIPPGQNDGVTPSQARALLVTFAGRIRHAGDAGLTADEQTALELRCAGAPDRRIARAVRLPAAAARRLLEGAAAKISGYHFERAKEVLAVCDNKSLAEPRMIEDAAGNPQELKLTGGAEDEKLRIHPDVKPTPGDLSAPVDDALAAIIL